MFSILFVDFKFVSIRSLLQLTKAKMVKNLGTDLNLGGAVKQHEGLQPAHKLY